MEGLARLVAESMARHGIDVRLDYRRLQWSRWFACHPNADRPLVPSMPGLFAVGEELVGAGDKPVAEGTGVLAIFAVREAQDLEIALGRLLSQSGELRERIAKGHVFVRYTIIEDADQRRAAQHSFERWLAAENEAASRVSSKHGILMSEPIPALENKAKAPTFSPVQCPAPLPSGF